MGAPVSLLQGARAFARDFARDSMPRGYLWDIADFVPTLIDTQLTNRGAWVWGSGAASFDFQCGILATFTAGEQNLGVDAGTGLWQISPNPPYDLTSRGAVMWGIQNPVQLFDQTVWFSATGDRAPTVVTATGIAAAGANAPNAKVGTIWKEYVVCGGAPGRENVLFFSTPRDVTAAWDTAAIFGTAAAITGLAALRSVILVFHAGTTERIRGSVPPHTGFTNDDLALEPLFGHAGTTEPKSICYWNENILFADEHGVHMTDGAAIRNLVQQGGISYYWRPLYENKSVISAVVFLDFYIVTINRTDGSAVTLVCDLNKRQWFKFTNIHATCAWGSGGSTGMERIFMGIEGSHRLARISPCFFPVLGSAVQVDANGTAVLPSFETPWYRMGQQEGRKRARFVYLSYDARTGPATVASDRAADWRAERLSEDVELTLPLDAPAPAAAADVLTMSYITSPQDTAFTSAGNYPVTNKYTRWRLPVGKAPYGIAFKVVQTIPTTVTRVFDLAVEAHSVERSRV